MSRTRTVLAAVSAVVGLVLADGFWSLTLARWPGLAHDRLPWLAVFLPASVGSAFAVYLVLARRIGPWLRRSGRAAVGMLAGAAALGVVVVAVSTPASQVEWLGTVGAGPAAPVAPTDQVAWGESRRGFDMHAIAARDEPHLWRVEASLPRHVHRFGGRLSARITQPDWSVLDDDGRPLQGADGLEIIVRVRRAGQWHTLASRRLHAHAYPDERRWLSFETHLPRGGRRVAVEILPGPVGGTNWYDRLLVSPTVTGRSPAAAFLLDWVTAAFLLLLLLVEGRAFLAPSPHAGQRRRPRHLILGGGVAAAAVAYALALGSLGSPRLQPLAAGLDRLTPGRQASGVPDEAPWPPAAGGTAESPIGGTPLGNGREVRTAYHILQVTHHADVAPATVAGGGLGRFGGDGYLLVTGDGAILHVRFSADSLDATRLPLAVPLNGSEFAEDAGEVADAGGFRVTGVMTRSVGEDSVRLVVSHHHWVREDRCFVLRLSTVVVPAAEPLDDAIQGGWETLHDTRPCLPIKTEGYPFAGTRSGGRILALGDTAVLMTVGDHEFDGTNGSEMLPQWPDNDYGKTLVVDLRRRAARVFTMGHRNPQGLHRDGAGRLWLTEHGPTGGDELNLLVPGGNYGWPLRTHGTDDDMTWRPAPAPESAGQMIEPRYAWVPSIGVSNLIEVAGTGLPRWRGNLLVASLRAGTLFRILVNGPNVVYAEPIVLGHRIRDLTEGDDGRIVLWTDDGSLISLRRAPAAEGMVLFQTCTGCHTADGAGSYVGPDLRAVYGRPVAGAGGFTYSGALASAGGSWTEARLDSFLANPAAFAPGTAKSTPGIPEPWAREGLVAYLKELQTREPAAVD